VILLEDGKPLTYKDAKMAMASVQAFKELMLRAHGEAPKNDAEIEALQTQGVKILVITPPAEMMRREILTEPEHTKLEPKFIEGEIVPDKK
jgi:ABC-type xylose transport system substrate-binding protein